MRVHPHTLGCHLGHEEGKRWDLWFISHVRIV
jgi:hypothetical protein